MLRILLKHKFHKFVLEHNISTILVSFHYNFFYTFLHHYYFTGSQDYTAPYYAIEDNQPSTCSWLHTAWKTKCFAPPHILPVTRVKAAFLMWQLCKDRARIWILNRNHHTTVLYMQPARSVLHSVLMHCVCIQPLDPVGGDVTSSCLCKKHWGHVRLFCPYSRRRCRNWVCCVSPTQDSSLDTSYPV